MYVGRRRRRRFEGTTLMAGPKRARLAESVPSPKGDGILLPVSARVGQRFKRGTNMGASAFFNWPAQFDQLRTGLEPGAVVCD